MSAMGDAGVLLFPPFALGLAKLLETGETIQVLDVDAFGRRGQHLTSLRSDAEMRSLG
jgi:hypothetical protein